MQKINNICHIDAGVYIEVCLTFVVCCQLLILHICFIYGMPQNCSSRSQFFFFKFVKAFTYSCLKTLSEFSLNCGNIEYLNQAGFSCVLCQ